MMVPEQAASPRLKARITMDPCRQLARVFLYAWEGVARRSAVMEKQILSEDDMRRALARIAHEIIERHRGVDGLVLAGIRTRGLPLAQRIAQKIQDFEGADVPVAAMDTRLYRDDVPQSSRVNMKVPSFPVEINDRKVVLVDDVLFTGRTARAALDALTDCGRPRQVQLAVLVDRGHRELPIRADYVGKNIPTAQGERVEVLLTEIDGKDEVVLTSRPVRAGANFQHGSASHGLGERPRI